MPELGESRNAAVSRLKQVERRLANDPHRLKQYSDFMQEYIDLGQMSIIPTSELEKPNQNCYYLPHHAVIRDASKTTKLRVVFDGSAKSTSGISLNEKLMVGPQLQDELVHILLRFRLHKVALIADITKFFRQFSLNKQHWDFHRIVWRKSPLDPIQDYYLKTVTYGTAAGPYLASRGLHQLAIDEKERFPTASAITLRDFYVDDLMSGSTDSGSAIALYTELTQLMKAGGMELRKWSTNDPTVLAAIPEIERGTEYPFKIEEDESTKTLGLIWHPASDQFSFTVNLSPLNEKITKRAILSDIAKLFDPLGWLAPVIVKAKMLMQKLWLAQVSWDESVPEELQVEWLKYRYHLAEIQDLKIPRCIVTTGNLNKYELYGFCDASEEAYAAVVFLGCVNADNEKSVNQLCSKTRVAPLKQISLPRLELCGAVLLAKLLKKVESALGINLNEIYAWSDSTIVLSWLAKPPKQWTTFVANRVSEIQGLIAPNHWQHVKSAENPADQASRGVFPADLISSSLW